MDNKQHEALKRKIDQAMEQTRRSLEAVDIHRRNLIDNELALLYSAMDLKNLTDSLVNDQEVLYKCLCDLKAMKDKSEATDAQIKIEEDLEVRGAQIIEMTSKQEDLDAKVKKLAESFKTIPELRIALSHILNKLLESRNDYKKQLTKAEERIKQLLAENSDQKVRKNKSNVQKVVPKRQIVIKPYSVESAIEDGGPSESNDNFRDPDYFPRSYAAQQVKRLKVTCACKTSCLKNHCVCKKAGSYCINCDCTNCLNIEPTEILIAEKKEFSVDL
ncbi:unnamed protein product [Chironomus riparius]|uniref:CRC domain-containing protein n=1 Tax=Chironomus riparius TaxID=315576 RepID=A0A9N9S5R8_9DIPT|nr:unnamed protein product [Chironomus riparius]